MKGTVKEGVSETSDDIKAEREGAVEQTTTKAKETAEDVKKMTGEAAEEASTKIGEVAGNVKDALKKTLDGVRNTLNKDEE